MRVVKYPLTVVLLTALSVGLVYSQLCNTVCAFYGCSPSAVARNLATGGFMDASREETRSDCSKHNQAGHQGGKDQARDSQAEPRSAPQRQGDPHGSGGCPSHADHAVVISTASASSCAATLSNLQVVDGEFLVEDSTPAKMLAGQSSIARPDRSPPRRTVSVLRI